MTGWFAIVLIFISILVLLYGLVRLVLGIIKKDKGQWLMGSWLAVIGAMAYLMITQWVWKEKGNAIAFQQLVGTYRIQYVSPEWEMGTTDVSHYQLTLDATGKYQLSDTLHLGVGAEGEWTYDGKRSGQELCFTSVRGSRCFPLDKSTLEEGVKWYRNSATAPTHIYWSKK
ncbi:MAG: hypothetical protein MUE33_02770 [Cytophagaceae bacterium]|jgi:hypothetical protein|nr:hypothetical protein [Cytophagaceae bacterium]